MRVMKHENYETVIIVLERSVEVQTSALVLNEVSTTQKSHHLHFTLPRINQIMDYTFITSAAFSGNVQQMK